MPNSMLQRLMGGGDSEEMEEEGEEERNEGVMDSEMTMTM